MSKPLEVVAAVIVKEGKVLCTQRNRNTSLGMKWEFPGGKVEPHETNEEAIVREIKEELNCTISVQKLVGTSLHHYDFATISLTAYFCKLQDDTITLQEHESARWLLPSELPSLDWSGADVAIVKLVVEAMK